MEESEKYRFVVEPECVGQRLDLYLVDRFANRNLTRSRIKGLIDDGLVLVEGKKKKAGCLLRGLEKIAVIFPRPTPSGLEAEEVDFSLLHEDEEIVVLSKPPGIVVHPACGHNTGTLVHGLLHHCGDLSGISGEIRPGIVHRLGKETSGVMVVAKNDRAHRFLARQFKAKQVKKTYYAVVEGILRDVSGTIDLPIGRHPVRRQKMAVRRQGGREAVTHWRRLETFAAGYTSVELRPETGRTHQIRVHMAAMGHPLAGDAVYGRKNRNKTLFQITRQCLHAASLTFLHPGTEKTRRFTAPLWPDIAATLQLLRKEKTGGFPPGSGVD